MITKDKVTEIFCIIDEFDKNLDGELKRNLRLSNQDGNGKRYRNSKGRLSESEIMTILICYHFGTYRNFKYYQNCIRGCFHKEFPHAVSYNRRAHASCILQNDALHEALYFRQVYGGNVR